MFQGCRYTKYRPDDDWHSVKTLFEMVLAVFGGRVEKFHNYKILY